MFGARIAEADDQAQSGHRFDRRLRRT